MNQPFRIENHLIFRKLPDFCRNWEAQRCATPAQGGEVLYHRRALTPEGISSFLSFTGMEATVTRVVQSFSHDAIMSLYVGVFPLRVRGCFHFLAGDHCVFIGHCWRVSIPISTN